jgi:SAM-dependent methyltransferase
MNRNTEDVAPSIAPARGPHSGPGPAHAFALPGRLGMLARLHGLAIGAPRRAVVLEIGVGDGTNLLSLAALHPEATLVGLDASSDAVFLASARARTLGLGNVMFVTGELASAPELPTADYIIAIDVCSHLTRMGRARLFALIAERLQTGGVAVVGFDTLPGANDFEPLRALMRFHVARVADATVAVRQSREIAHWHVERMSRLHGDDRVGIMRRILDEIDGMSDERLIRTLTEDVYEPLTLVDFAREIGEHGLQWLTNARREEPRSSELPSHLADLARHDPVRRQQYLDYFLMTRQRTSVICRAGEPVVREAELDAVRPFRVAGRVASHKLRPFHEDGGGAHALSPPLVFSTSVGDVIVSDEASDVLWRLSAHMPSSVAVEELLGQVPGRSEAEILGAVVELWRAELVELVLEGPLLAHESPDHPRTGALQRLLAAELADEDGEHELVSLWHRDWALDREELAALARMDGSVRREDFDDEVMRKLLHKGFVVGPVEP